MKHFILMLFVTFLFINGFSQSFSSSCKEIQGKTRDVETLLDSFIVVIKGPDKKTILQQLQHSFLGKATLDSLAKKFAPSRGNNKKVDDLFENAPPPNPAGTLQIKLDLLSLWPESAESLALIFSCDGKKGDTIPIKRDTTKKSKSPALDIPYRPVTFITQEIIRSVQDGSTCNLCVMREPIEIPKKRDRKYSTDYIVLYDPMLKEDAYTICKHIFRKKDSGGTKKLEERYKKIANKWFAPHVGSQIRFEIVNQPLTDPKRITVDALDLFNAGSAQFQGIINSQVNTGIINRLNPSAAAPGDTAKKSVGAQSTKEDTATREATPSEKLKMLHDQLIDYVSVFRLSSCTIDQHMRNLPEIIGKINKEFGTSASGAVAITGQLKNKFANSEELKTLVDEIGNLLTLLKDLRPMAFTTLRAKNRDYLVVKTFDANNTELSTENIRLSGGLKIDFSAGFVLTGLRDFSYILKDTSVKYQRDPNQTATTDTSGNILIRENIGKRQVGVGILTHVYPRISSNYNLGLTIGLMSSTELDLRFMLGGSLMFSSLFGSNNRVSLNGGVVWGKVKRLSNAYYEGYKVINNKPIFYAATTPVSTVTVPVTEHSWFFALTMNFGGN